MSRNLPGRGSGVTPQFEVATQRLMTFESSDAVMVVYLLNERDEVVQNLHKGGKGEGFFLIEVPGRYHRPGQRDRTMENPRSTDALTN